MLSWKSVRVCAWVASLALTGNAAWAQAYPSKNVMMISSVVGGPVEATLRMALETVHANTGATLVFDARPGASGGLALEATKRAAPDGYTFGITYASALTLNPLTNRQLGMDPLKDFMPVTALMGVGVVLAVPEGSPYKDLRDLTAAAKANPDTVTLGVFGAGNRVWTAMLEERTGAKFVQVPYKTITEVMQATLGGHQQAHFDMPAIVVSQKGRLRALSFGGTKPSPQLPGVPLVRDLYKFDMQSWFAVVAPVGTPKAAVDWMARELARAMKDPKVTQMADQIGMSVIADTPDQFAATLRAEVEANAEILRKYPDIR